MDEEVKTIGRKPDYRLKVLNKITNETATVGAAWKDDKGNIGIKINLCSVLTNNPDLVYTLFPA